MNKLLLLTPLLFLLIIGVVGATAPSAIPSGIQYYVPINLTNSQSTATASPFQQMVNLSESNATYGTHIAYSGSTANFEYFYTNGTIVPAWIESNSSGKLITWVKTVSIPASSKITIYLGFVAKTTNLLSSSGTSGIGEAPQLPCGTTATSSCSTYAEYDDGASVFNFYDNFKGTTLNTTKWDIASGASATVDNGVTVSLASGDNWYGIYTASFTTTQSIAETYAKDNGGTNSGFDIATDGVTYQENSGTPDWGFGTGGTVSSSPTANGASSTTDAPAANTFYLFGAVINSGSPLIQVAYNTLVTGTYSITTPTAIGLGTSASNSAFFQWFRVRAYPPSGVMPSVSFGAVQSIYPTLSISPNPATYGQSVTITATCPVSTDTCAIDYPSLGTAIATGTGSATYTWNTTKEGIGTFSSFYANDITQGTNSTPQSLTTYVPINIYYANATSSEIHKTLNTSGLYLIPKCTNNAASLSSGYCIGNMVYSTSTTLSGNIYVYGNLTIDSGVTITENGHYLYATGTFDNLGTITGGNNPNAPGGGGGPGGGSSSVGGGSGTSITTSYAGSGGGGGGGGDGGGSGGSGGSTLAAGGGGGSGGTDGSGGGTGSTPSAPTMSQSLAFSMFDNIASYLSSASGGGGSGGFGGGSGGAGGSGVFGVAIGGNKVIAGTINTNGNAGAAGGAGGSYGGGGGGGGTGASSILIVYTSSYTAGTYSDTGGAGGAGGSATYPGGSGGAGGNGQVITYSTSLLPSVSPATDYYYPLKYNASTISNTINFNVSIFKNGITTYQSSNQSLLYLPAQTSIYLLSFKEQQGTAKVYLNTTFVLNTTDIKSAFNFSDLIQYFPILAHTPTWTVKPSSWEIIPANEPISDQQLNTSSGAVFSSPNLAVSFVNVIKLNYPFTSFYLNLTDNPKVQTSITLKPFKFTLANSIITSLSNIANFSLFSQYTFNGIAGVNATMKLLGTFNAYSFNTIISNNTDTNGYYYLQIPKSNYTNPNITLTINASYTKTSPAYYTQTDLYCPLTASPGTAGMFYTGLVDSNGTKYTFYVSSASGSTLSGDLMQVIEQSGVKTIQVQSLMLPNTTPFTVPLEAAGESYAFDITNQPCTTYYYKGGLSVPSNPIYIFVNQLTGAYVYNVTKVFGACKITNFTQSSFPVLCVGGDPTSLTYKWKLQVFRVTSAIGTEVPIYNKTVLGSTLDLNFTLPKINTTTNTTNTYVYALFAYTDKSSDPVVGVNGGQLNFEKIIASASMWGFLALILGMILIFVGVVSGKPIIILGLANILLWVVGFFTPIVVPYYVIIASLILSAIGVYWTKKKA